jgi:hypothetical protein
VPSFKIRDGQTGSGSAAWWPPAADIPGHDFGNSVDFEQYPSGLDHGHPAFHRAFSIAHAHFEGFFE